MTDIFYGSRDEVLHLDKANPDYDTVCARTIHLSMRLGRDDYADVKKSLLETAPMI